MWYVGKCVPACFYAQPNFYGRKAIPLMPLLKKQLKKQNKCWKYMRICRRIDGLAGNQGSENANERFAGAEDTYCIEALMQDGKALQAGTSHFLGQNFAKAFDVKFSDKENKLEYVWATSWGVSTRLIGALVMAHSDDEGLILPPKIAPLQVVIVPIYKGDEQKTKDWRKSE